MAAFRGLLTAGLVVLGGVVASAQDASPERALPNGPGLAARYVGDRGLADDPAVLLFEDFETGDVADLAKRWDSVNNENERVIDWKADVPARASGNRSIEFTATVPENDGGYLYKKLPREVDTAFARFYVKFPKDAGYIHHFVHFGGYRPPRAGRRVGLAIDPAATSG